MALVGFHEKRPDGQVFPHFAILLQKVQNSELRPFDIHFHKLSLIHI